MYIYIYIYIYTYVYIGIHMYHRMFGKGLIHCHQQLFGPFAIQTKITVFSIEYASMTPH